MRLGTGCDALSLCEHGLPAAGKGRNSTPFRRNPRSANAPAREEAVIALLIGTSRRPLKVLLVATACPWPCFRALYPPYIQSRHAVRPQCGVNFYYPYELYLPTLWACRPSHGAGAPSQQRLHSLCTGAPQVEPKLAHSINRSGRRCGRRSISRSSRTCRTRGHRLIALQAGGPPHGHGVW